jgi:hypothetical protein
VTPEDLAKRQREMALWCFPVVTDFLYRQYAERTGLAHHDLRLVSFNHAQYWRALILDQRNDIDKYRIALNQSLALGRIDRAIARQLNEDLLDELMRVVSERYKRSPLRISEDGHVLFQVTRRLTEIEQRESI